MTANQIAYWRAVEEARSNRAKEDETKRSNIARERELSLSRSEQTRHNKAGEDISLGSLSETVRSNKAREKETARSNRAKEILQGLNFAHTVTKDNKQWVSDGLANIVELLPIV